MSIELDYDEPTDGGLDEKELLGQDIHKWTSQDKSVSLTFGRARGNASYKVAKVLGQSQSANIVANTMLLAILGIRTFNGEEFTEPYTEREFEFTMSRFGTYDTCDTNFNDYVVSWQMALHPDTMRALRDAEGAGATPQELDAVAKNAGKSLAKKSRAPRGSTKS